MSTPAFCAAWQASGRPRAAARWEVLAVARRWSDSLLWAATSCRKSTSVRVLALSFLSPSVRGSCKEFSRGVLQPWVAAHGDS